MKFSINSNPYQSFSPFLLYRFFIRDKGFIFYPLFYLYRILFVLGLCFFLGGCLGGSTSTSSDNSTKLEGPEDAEKDAEEETPAPVKTVPLKKPIRRATPKTMECEVENGEGQKNWNDSLGRWNDECEVISCEGGFDDDDNNNACQPTPARHYSPAGSKDRMACMGKPLHSSWTDTTGLASLDDCAWVCTTGYDKNQDSTQCQATSPTTPTVTTTTPTTPVTTPVTTPTTPPTSTVTTTTPTTPVTTPTTPPTTTEAGYASPFPDLSMDTPEDVTPSNVSAYDLRGRCSDDALSVHIRVEGFPKASHMILYKIGPFSVPCTKGRWGATLDFSLISRSVFFIEVTQANEEKRERKVKKSLKKFTSSNLSCNNPESISSECYIPPEQLCSVQLSTAEIERRIEEKANVDNTKGEELYRGQISYSSYGFHFENEYKSLLFFFLKLTAKKDKKEILPQATTCKKVLCFLKEIFGDDLGPRLLYIIQKYGLNGSHLAFHRADKWKVHELDILLQGLEDLPNDLLPIQKNRPLVLQRIRLDGKCTFVANSELRFFGCGLWYSEMSRLITFIHELGHYVGGAGAPSGSPLHSSPLSISSQWKTLSGWQVKGKDQVQWGFSQDACFFSEYAKTDPWEDFAESFAAYRYLPSEFQIPLSSKVSVF